MPDFRTFGIVLVGIVAIVPVLFKSNRLVRTLPMGTVGALSLSSTSSWQESKTATLFVVLMHFYPRSAISQSINNHYLQTLTDSVYSL
jgi:hypothetical protein